MTLSTQELFLLQRKSGEILREAGKIILDNWNDIKDITYKDVRDVVTNVDIEVENWLRKKLRELLPEAGFIVEEGDDEESKHYRWSIDPIDGTKYFATKTPLFLTQIALVKGSESIIGHIYNPTVDHLFSASSGNGAFLNEESIILPEERSIENAIIDVILGGNDRILLWKIQMLSLIIKRVYRVRSLGSAYHAYVLTGGLDGIVQLRQDEKFVDSAPGLIIYKEAGLNVATVQMENKQIRFVGRTKLIDALIESMHLNH